MIDTILLSKFLESLATLVLKSLLLKLSIAQQIVLLLSVILLIIVFNS